MRTLIKAFLPLCLLLTFAGAALAQTPDGQPPSQETVCDAETGAAYGLCNAYCEAMDCDSNEPDASATACGKVRGKFQNITGRDVPCEEVVVVCPCTSIPRFNDVLANANFCVTVGETRNELLDAAFNVSIADSDSCSFTPFGEAGIFIPVTPEESAVCLQLFLDIEASRGLTCLPG